MAMLAATHMGWKTLVTSMIKNKTIIKDHQWTTIDLIKISFALLGVLGFWGFGVGVIAAVGTR